MIQLDNILTRLATKLGIESDDIIRDNWSARLNSKIILNKMVKESGEKSLKLSYLILAKLKFLLDKVKFNEKKILKRRFDSTCEILSKPLFSPIKETHINIEILFVDYNFLFCIPTIEISMDF